MSWPLALRLARREVLRRPGRAALVVLLVAIPVAGMTTAAVLFRTSQLPAAEQFALEHGGADAVHTTVPAAPAHRAALGDDTDGVVTSPALAALPPGAERVDVRTVDLLVRGPDSPRRFATATDAPVGERYRLVEGREPRARGEAALSRRAAKLAGVELGDEVTISADTTLFLFDEGRAVRPVPEEAQRVTVAGLVEDVRCLSCSLVVAHPGQPLPQANLEVAHRVRLPDTLAVDDLRRLAEAGWELAPELKDTALLGVETEGDESTEAVVWTVVIGAVVLTAAGIVMSAAFAVGARRQLTTLGQLSAAGAPPGLLRRTLGLQGTVSGALGVLAGWLLAGVVLGPGRGLVESRVDQRFAGWDVRAPDLAAIVAVALVVVTVAAFVPAHAAVRIPTLAALAGRRPLAAVPRAVPIVGLAAIGCGLGLTALAVLGAAPALGNRQVWAAVGVVGGVFQLLGAAAVTPALAGRLEPMAARLRGSWRLGTRSLARNRARTGAVLAAVAATGALAVFAGGQIRGLNAVDNGLSRPQLSQRAAVVSIAAFGPVEDAASGAPVDGAGGGVTVGDEELHFVEDAAEPFEAPLAVLPDEETLARVRAILPSADEAVLREARQRPDEAGTELWEVTGSEAFAATFDETAPLVAGPDMLAALDAPQDLIDLVADEGLVWLTFVADPPGRVTVRLPDGTELSAVGRPNDLFDLELLPVGLTAGLLVSPELSASLGLAERDVAAAYRSPEPLTAEQRGRLQDLALDASLAEGATGLLRIATASSAGLQLRGLAIETALAGAALVITLLVIGASLALTAAESRDEREVLTVAGARPRDLARAAGVRAGILAGLGGALAAPLGLAPVVVIWWTAGERTLLRPPWLTVVLLVAAAPLLAALVARVASAVAQRARPVRISTATFE